MKWVIATICEWTIEWSDILQRLQVKVCYEDFDLWFNDEVFSSIPKTNVIEITVDLTDDWKNNRKIEFRLTH
jgi:hypothetical protein